MVGSRLFGLFVCLIVVGCKTSRTVVHSEAEPTQSSWEQIDMKPVLLASIERTACYGQCPMYKTTYMDNGQIIYVGKRFVENIGTYSALLNEEEIALIKEKVEELGYFKLDSLYPTVISDFPSCITEVNIGGKRKKVIDRHDPPKELRMFEKFLDSLLADKKLRKLSDDTHYEPH